ncbi:MAG TPA: HlyC/CorC family transporter [Clostridiales bacterium]|nr:HlyC/CorC family transporter [Clostridiales bacterium]
MNVQVYIILIVVCILFSAYFSATETAFMSYSHIKMKTLADDGNRKAKRVLALSDKFDNILSTILIGNNIVNILATSFSTLLFIHWLGNSNGPTISTVVMTITVLIFGEITPKSIAKERPESFAMFTAPIIGFLSLIFFPLNWFFGLFKKLFRKIFKKKEEETGTTEDELITFVEEAEEDGKIGEDESELIRSAIEFDDIEAIEIFTPRVDVAAIPDNSTEDEIAKVFSETGYSRLPVYKGTIDNIIGILHLKDFYSRVYKKGKNFKSVMKQPVFVMPSIKVSDLLELFQKSKSHIAIISDEFGGTEGIVTMEDILEELVGEIWDEHDDVVEDISEKDGVVTALGTASIEDVYDKFGIELKDEEVESSMVGGFIIDKLGKIPNEGDKFTFDNVEVTVTKTEYRRIIEAEFRLLTPPDEEQEK